MRFGSKRVVCGVDCKCFVLSKCAIFIDMGETEDNVVGAVMYSQPTGKHGGIYKGMRKFKTIVGLFYNVNDL